ncbi:MerR family transcriptional regulator [Enterococcus sp. NPDC086594]|uniref:MerR family transcriptional regulator n=1 Tax=Enterococcus sp. NPDC086594 TaxID=3363992 RepID=UPI003812EFDF
MDEILSITKLARLRNISTETLRHYDRIGLLKPDKISETSRERYYSIYQYEKLGTIKELKQMGLSLKEIKAYFENRNIDTTRTIISDGLISINEKIEELTLLKKSLENKLDFLNGIEDKIVQPEIKVKMISEDRYYLVSDNTISNELELSYAAIKLETAVSKNEQFLPIFASNRFMGIYVEQDNNPKLCIQVENMSEADFGMLKISKGNYLCLAFKGEFFEGTSYIKKIMNYAKRNGFMLEKSILQVQWLDYTFIENRNEVIYEIQCKLC